VKLSHSIFLTLATLVLAGCSANEVDLESRSINVQQTAQPAGGPLTQGTANLVGQAGPSYVTLTVSTVSDKIEGKARDNTSPVTSGSGFVVDGRGYVMTAMWRSKPETWFQRAPPTGGFIQAVLWIFCPATIWR
jgi:hypothetical protein